MLRCGLALDCVFDLTKRSLICKDYLKDHPCGCKWLINNGDWFRPLTGVVGPLPNGRTPWLKNGGKPPPSTHEKQPFQKQMLNDKATFRNIEGFRGFRQILIFYVDESWNPEACNCNTFLPGGRYFEVQPQ